MDETERALYITSGAAELAGVHPQTLRIYERKGLIEPKRTEGRSRRYSDRDIELLQHIQELTNEGVGLAGDTRAEGPPAAQTPPGAPPAATPIATSSCSSTSRSSPTRASASPASSASSSWRPRSRTPPPRSRACVRGCAR